MKKYRHSLQDDIGYWLSRLRMRVHTSFLAKISKEGVSIAEWRVLVSLYNNDASNVVELAEFIEIDKGAVSRIINRLETNGMVIRQQGKDRRSIIVRLTDKGEMLTPKLARLADTNEKEFFACLNDEEKIQLRKILAKLLRSAGIDSLGGKFFTKNEVNNHDK